MPALRCISHGGVSSISEESLDGTGCCGDKIFSSFFPNMGYFCTLRKSTLNTLQSLKIFINFCQSSQARTELDFLAAAEMSLWHVQVFQVLLRYLWQSKQVNAPTGFWISKGLSLAGVVSRERLFKVCATHPGFPQFLQKLRLCNILSAIFLQWEQNFLASAQVLWDYK